jgi:DNA recombination-dependent growth factor C
MTKDQLLQLVSEAYDEGADFGIRFHPNSKKKADELADQFAEHFTTPCRTDSNQGTGWHKFESENRKVDLVTYYEEVQLCVNCQK